MFVRTPNAVRWKNLDLVLQYRTTPAGCVGTLFECAYRRLARHRTLVGPKLSSTRYIRTIGGHGHAPFEKHKEKRPIIRPPHTPSNPVQPYFHRGPYPFQKTTYTQLCHPPPLLATVVTSSLCQLSPSNTPESTTRGRWSRKLCSLPLNNRTKKGCYPICREKTLN